MSEAPPGGVGDILGGRGWRQRSGATLSDRVSPEWNKGAPTPREGTVFRGNYFTPETSCFWLKAWAIISVCLSSHFKRG